MKNDNQNIKSNSKTGDQVDPNGGEQFKHTPDQGYGNDTVSLDNQRNHEANDADNLQKQQTPNQKADDKTNREAQSQMGGMGDDEYNRVRDANRQEEQQKEAGKQHQSLGEKAKNAIKGSGGAMTDGMDAEKQKEEDRDKANAKDLGVDNQDDNDEMDMSKKAGEAKVSQPLKAKLAAMLHAGEAGLGMDLGAKIAADEIKQGAKDAWVKFNVGLHHLGEIAHNIWDRGVLLAKKGFHHLPNWLQKGMSKIGHALGNTIDKGAQLMEKGLVKATGGKLTMAKAATIVHLMGPTAIVAAGVTGGAYVVTQAIHHDQQKWDSMLCNFGADLKSRLGQSEEGLRNKVVELAETRVQAKIPYVWGGTDWDKGMDCSGLVMNCMQKAGFTDFPRNSSEQYQYLMKKGCKREDVSQAKPGDLGFVGDNGSEHVCIYKGDNTVIEEPEPGQPCHERKVYSGLYFVDCTPLYGKGNNGGDSSPNSPTAAGAGLSDNGKKIFDFLVKKEGFSGAGAAGAVGNAMQESTCNPKAWNPPPSGCAGIFQWSTRLGQNGDRFDQGGFCDVNNKDTWTLDNELKLTDKELNGGYHNVKTSVGKCTDPAQAAEIWIDKFEGAAGQNDAERENYAKQAYDQFNGSSISANDALLGQGGGSSGSGVTASGNDSAAKNADQMGECGKSTSNDGNGNVADGTGSIKESAPNGLLKWTKDDVPDDVKQYIHDPSKAGLAWGSTSGWSLPGGQCVDFSVSYFYALWKGSGAPKTVPGNGGDIAGNEANAMGGQVSNQPHAGAVVSIPGGTVESPGPWGHTFIVEHVLQNGDIIVAEQNMIGFGMKGGSGDDVGHEETWNYGLVTQKWYQDNHAQFFTPSKGSPNWGN